MRVPSIKFAHVRRGKLDEPPGLVGVARVDLRTKVLVKRLAPGDIAVIDHADLDRVSADELIACRPAAVVNAAIAPPRAARLFGDAVWVKVFENESPGPADLKHLLTDDPLVPQDAAHTEVEWELSQSNPKPDHGVLQHGKPLDTMLTFWTRAALRVVFAGQGTGQARALLPPSSGGWAASDLDLNSLPTAPGELDQAGISFMHPVSAKQAAELADALDDCSPGVCAGICAGIKDYGRGVDFPPDGAEPE